MVAPPQLSSSSARRGCAAFGGGGGALGARSPRHGPRNSSAISRLLLAPARRAPPRLAALGHQRAVAQGEFLHLAHVVGEAFGRRCRSRSGRRRSPPRAGGSAGWRWTIVLAAPVSCSAIRKSLAWRTPRARPFGMSMMVGRPAPMHSATWSKPIAQASSIDSVAPPPNRTPPNAANSRAPLQQQADQLEVVLVPADGDAVLGDAAEPGHDAVVEVLVQRLDVAHRHAWVEARAARSSARRSPPRYGRRSSGDAPA